MDRRFTTRYPPSSLAGTAALQRNITIYVLLCGIAGGLLVVISLLLLCKYCRCSFLAPGDDDCESPYASSRPKSSVSYTPHSERHLATDFQLQKQGSITRPFNSSKNRRGMKVAIENAGSELVTGVAERCITGELGCNPADRSTTGNLVGNLSTCHGSNAAHPNSGITAKLGLGDVLYDKKCSNGRESNKDDTPGEFPSSVRSSVPTPLPENVKVPTKSILTDHHCPSSDKADSTRRGSGRYKPAAASTVSYDSRRALRSYLYPENVRKIPTASSTRSPTSNSPGEGVGTGSTSFARGEKRKTKSVDSRVLSPSSVNPKMSLSWLGHRHSFPTTSSRNTSRVGGGGNGACSRNLWWHKQTSSESIRSSTTGKEANEESSRTPSWDWSRLEWHLQQWQQYSEQWTSDVDEEPKGKVRYNDPGSLESVHEEFLSHDSVLEDRVGRRQQLQRTVPVQYRELWDLRATLEETSDLSDTPQVDHSPSSPESPDIEMPTSHTTSFESNTEVPGMSVSHLPSLEPYRLFPTSVMAKRQSYRNIAASRFKREPPPNASPALSSTKTKPRLTHQGEDSLDTLETDVSSTDQSRLEQVTTSFESTADTTTTTDSNTGTDLAGATPPSLRLLSLRGDSGYKSMETAGQSRSEDLCEVQIHSPSSSTPCDAEPSKWTTTKRPSMRRNASKKRKEFLASERRVRALGDSVNECDCETESEAMDTGDNDHRCGGSIVVQSSTEVLFAKCSRYLHPSKASKTSQKVFQRDYSIDELTDALFREFSRCDPAYDDSTSARLRRLKHKRTVRSPCEQVTWPIPVVREQS